MKAYTKTKINENKKIESSETAETPPSTPTKQFTLVCQKQKKIPC